MRTALITGGARGLGRAITTELARDHAVAFTWNTTPPDAVAADLPDALAIQADLTAPGAAEDVIARTLARFGRIDVIVNNAGCVIPTPAGTIARDDIAAMTTMHLTAPAELLAAALPHLSPGAAIVNISSVNARLPPMGAGMYGATKAALDLWTRAMAKELGPRGIRVNAVAPGAINTPEAPRDPDLTARFIEMTALGSLATPQDIAQAVRFLASPAAAAITGEILTVSGGYRL
ncbi:SDR family NAD(P)-dependent oxidoreductase [Lacimonas salitolerans]|uniref:SDR family NAD(P)-dependent oxidoreductase n=1 Tax=Lacimonas salitolerans TaxID=1323750 RepID=A0ABW4EFQ0_9RHOB